MTEAESILKAREERAEAVKKIVERGNAVTVKANAPGANKRMVESYLLVRRFTRLALEKFGGRVVFTDGADGPCAIITDTDGCSKQAAVEIEQSPAGRFVDLDLWLKGSQKSLSRGYMRKCYICDQPAFVCARTSKHGVDELLTAFKSGTRAYFNSLISEIIRKSLTIELNLEDKFGLVTPTSQGSHADMNYELMVKSQKAIIPYLIQTFWVGADEKSAENILEKLRPIGIAAEKAMLAANGGVNAYKGLIFVFGILLAATGRALTSGSGGYGEIFAYSKHICRGITNELKENSAGNTFGATAYKRYGITGARGHAESGFTAVREAQEIIDEDFSPPSLLKALCFIVGNIEDTVLLKRCGGIEKYFYYREKISTADTTDIKEIKMLNGECIKDGVSIGGSADVLAAAVMLKLIRSSWYFN